MTYLGPTALNEEKQTPSIIKVGASHIITLQNGPVSDVDTAYLDKTDA